MSEGYKLVAAYPKTALAAFKRTKRASCFVLMPFAPAFDPVFRRIQETLESPGLDIQCTRADNFQEANILGTILRSIAQSEYIIADLTGLNPNVFYETGVAHCSKSADKVVIITQSLDDVPFDLRHLRCIIYSNSPPGMKRLKADLGETFSHLSKDVFRFRMHKGSRFALGKPLVGRDRNFFQLTFECPYLAHNAAKILVSYDERSVTHIESAADCQILVLSEDSPCERLDYIPWNLHVVRFEGNHAVFVLERRT